MGVPLRFLLRADELPIAVLCMGVLWHITGQRILRIAVLCVHMLFHAADGFTGGLITFLHVGVPLRLLLCACQLIALSGMRMLLCCGIYASWRK